MSTDFRLKKAVVDNRVEIMTGSKVDAFLLGWNQCRAAYHRPTLWQRYKALMRWEAQRINKPHDQ